MVPTKIVIIGAGSANFGLNTLGALMNSARLRGSHIALVDRNAHHLALMEKLARRINREWNTQMTITAHTHHDDALDGAQFVISAIEVPPREALWRSDWEIPLKYGVRQPYAENGGPGGFAHAARNIGPVMEIVHAMERACPEAWFINFTNPMMRICDAIARYSRIRVIGLCHQIRAGYGMIGNVLANDFGFHVPEGEISTHAHPDLWTRLHVIADQAIERVEVTAAGVNHFTWMLELHDKRTGADLYPLFAERWSKFDSRFEPLTRDVYRAFGLFPIPGDEHLCEYLPWVSDPTTAPWDKYDISLYDWEWMDHLRNDGHAEIDKMGNGELGIDHLHQADGEGSVEVIESIAGGSETKWRALNLPNRGYITNLPDDAIVEIPGRLDANGAHGNCVGALPEPIAELCRREVTAVRLCVDAAVQGNRQTALQCLLLDPVIRDMSTAQKILDDYLVAYREHLPQFWKSK